MPLREDILNPIAGENPSGENLYYTPLYDQVKEARREDDGASQGEWEHAVKTAEYDEVVKLCQPALAEKTKDLQLAVWLAEALIYEEGIPGLDAGLNLIRGLVENFWDTVYPELEDGDAEFRAAPVEWFGNYYDPGKGSSPALALRRIPLTRSGLGLLNYRQAKSVPTEEEAKLSEKKAEDRSVAIEEGKLTPESFDVAFRETPKTFYRTLEADLKTAGESIDALGKLCDEKFGDVAPGFRELKTALEEVSVTARILLQEKLKIDPDPVPVDETAAEGAEGDLGVGIEGLEGVGEAGGAGGEGQTVAASAQLRSRQDAVRLLLAAAQYLRRSTPDDPAGYMVVRALRWGELRSGNGDGSAIGLLEAPPAETRLALKTAAAAGEWGKVLEISEGAAARGCGRAWLDLHRYAIRACEELGHEGVARALRSGLKELLSDLPRLPSMTLADDTGTANPETLNWLIQESLYDPAQTAEQVSDE